MHANGKNKQDEGCLKITMGYRGWFFNRIECRAVWMGEGARAGAGADVGGRTGRPLGRCGKGVCSAGTRRAASLWAAGSRHQGGTSWESKCGFPGPDSSLCPENQAAERLLGWDEPLATAPPVSFPDRCSHSPACTCGLSATHTPAPAPVLAGSVLGRTSLHHQAPSS